MSDPVPYAAPPAPGTYRITNVLTKSTVIEVAHYNQERAASSKWVNTPNQHWIVQYSGRGYKFKNRQYGVYLAASNGNPGGIVGTASTPTRWSLMRTQAGFVIQYEEVDAVVNLHFADSRNDNVMLLWTMRDCPAHRRWIFEHISDDTGNEIADTTESQIHQMEKELAEKNERLALQAEELARKDQLLAAQAAALRQTELLLGGTEDIVPEDYNRQYELEKAMQKIRIALNGLDAQEARQVSLRIDEI